MKLTSLAPNYFEALYAADPDPWCFGTSEYERRKYAATAATLIGHEIQSAFEVGCSIGILTRQLARHCQSLLAVDVAEEALRQARQNCSALSQVRFARMQIPAEWPTEEFDLIVLSEVLYYFSPDDIRLIAQRTTSSLLPGGIVLLVHWTGETNYPCSGDQAVDCYLAACADAISPLLVREELEYRLDLLMRRV